MTRKTAERPGGLTKAQIDNLRHVRDHGQPTPKSRAGYSCRIKGLSEFIWLYTDGAIASVSERAPAEGAWLDKIVGERLTPAGRAILAQEGE